MSHDPPEIILIWWFGAKETFLIIINAENTWAAKYFCVNRDTFFFTGYFDEQKKKTAFNWNANIM